jgi:hypothetical protein
VPSANKVFEKKMQDGGFGRVGENMIIIILVENLDLIFTQAPRSAKMEITIFVRKGYSFLFLFSSPRPKMIIQHQGRKYFETRSSNRRHPSSSLSKTTANMRSD